MLHILAIAVRQIIYACIRNLRVKYRCLARLSFKKRSKFCYYFRFPSFYFLGKKPVDVIFHDKETEIILLSFSTFIISR